MSEVLSTGREVVYTTETGEQPRGGPSLTDEATKPLPEPVKRIAKKTTKKRKPRVVAKAEPVQHIKVDKRVWARAKQVVAEGTYTSIQIVDRETVIVR